MSLRSPAARDAQADHPPAPMAERTDLPDFDEDAGDEPPEFFEPLGAPRRRVIDPATYRQPRPDPEPERTPEEEPAAEAYAPGAGNDMVEGWTPDDPWRPYTSEEAKKKARGGRPKLPAAKKRSAQLHVLLTPAERDRVKEWAASTGLSVSDYVRRRTLGKPIAPRVDLVARRELNAIGTNLNQIARAANQAGQVELAHEARAVYEEVMRAVRALDLPPVDPPEMPHYPFRRADTDD